MKKGAVFLDRDGVIVEERSYITNKNQVKLIKGSAKGIRLLSESGFLVICITNQSALGRGMVNEKQLSNIHQYMKSLLLKDNARLDAIYYCPHTPDENIECSCRKPNTGLIEKAQLEFEIDLEKSYIIGDRFSDMKLGENTGVKAIYVKSGYNEYDIIKNEGIILEGVYQTLYDAVQYIIKNKNEE